MFLGVVLAVAFAACVPQIAGADIAAPVIVPAPDSAGIIDATAPPACAKGGAPFGDNTWLTCLLPDHDAVVDWPSMSTEVWPGPRSFILPTPGLFATWLGESRTEIGRPLIWYDVGSGLPVSPASGGYQFPLAGKYAWECLVCSGIERDKLQGTMYVIGPRAIVNYSRVSADNSGDNITYGFDASASFVADYTPHSIVQYAFDFQDDGTYDQTSPEPTGQATYSPGPHTMRVKVTDDIGRTGEYPIFFEIPYVKPGNPTPPVTTDLNLGNINSGVAFPKNKIKVKASKKIKVSVLRSRGLAVKITGLDKGDKVKARLFMGKKSVVASGSGTSTSTTKNVRLRVSRKGKRYLKTHPKRLVIDISIEGNDGFTTTKRVGIRIT
jgi:hypothetical protein